jgi:hypothetical protein
VALHASASESPASGATSLPFENQRVTGHPISSREQKLALREPFPPDSQCFGMRVDFEVMPLVSARRPVHAKTGSIVLEENRIRQCWGISGRFDRGHLPSSVDRRWSTVIVVRCPISEDGRECDQATAAQSSWR